MTAHLPVLLVVLPLLAGICASLLGKQRSWWLALLTCWVTFALSLALAAQVHAEGPVSYALGGWGPDAERGLWVGIEYRVDRVNALVLAVVAGLAAAVTPFAGRSVASELAPERLRFFYAAWLLGLAGLLGITVTGDAFNLYVLLEISSLTSYALVALGKDKDRRALSASFTYLVMGTVGASFILLGTGYLFMATGTLNMGELAQRLEGLHDNRTVRTAFAFIAVGLSLKMALFPVHQWLPNAYTYAPTAVSALLASTATKVGVYVALRFLFTIFGTEFSFQVMALDTVLLAAASLAVLVGSLLAIRQQRLKRLLAYSSVAQIGYMVLGMGLANVHGVSGTLLHLVNHALVKGALFVAAGAVIFRLGDARLDDLAGLGKRMPLTAVVLTGGGLGLIGVPLTGGFVSKWFLVAGALEAGLWPIALVILAGSLLAVVYVLRFLQPIYFGTPAGEDAAEAPPAMILPGLALLTCSLVLGCGGALASDFVHQAALDLLGAAQ